MSATTSEVKHTLETTIDTVLSEMANEDPFSAKYANMADQLTKLYALKETDHKIKTDNRVSKETWATIAANLAGIAIIVGHERAHVVTSKALSFIMKMR